MSFVEFVKIRETIGTQADVATELETARRTFGRWERGERPVPGIAAAAIKLLAAEHQRRRARTQEAIALLSSDVAR